MIHLNKIDTLWHIENIEQCYWEWLVNSQQDNITSIEQLLLNYFVMLYKDNDFMCKLYNLKVYTTSNFEYIYYIKCMYYWSSLTLLGMQPSIGLGIWHTKEHKKDTKWQMCNSGSLMNRVYMIHPERTFQ